MSVKAEASNGTTAPPPAPAAAAAAPTVVITPMVVIGTLKFDPATNECTLTGKWAMNQADMDSNLDHLRNDCMYVGKGRLPGSFQGHFFMYQKLKAKGKVVMKNTKIVDAIRTITFEEPGANGSDMAIKGGGSNKFGAFNLTGSLTMPEGENEGKFTLFKHFLPKPKRKQPKKNNNARLRGPLGALQGSDFTAPNMGRRSTSDRKRKTNPKFKETLNEPEVTLKGPLKKCDKLILVLMKGGDKNKKQMAEIFNNPVDLTKFTTYAQDIKPSHPICFMDVKRKLYQGKYTNYDFFANDVRRVFHNAFVFNREEKLGFVYQAAVELSNEFEKKMSKLHNEEVEKARKNALEKAKIEEEKRRKKEEAKQRAAEKKRKEKERERQRKEKEKERKRKQKEKEKEKKRKEKERMKKSSSKSERKGRKSAGGQLTAKQLERLMAQSGGVQNQLDMMKQMEWMRNEIAQLRQNRGGSADGGSSGNSGSNNRKRKKPSASTPKLWDFNAKAELTEKINKLLTHDDAYMDVIMQMIQDYGNIQVDDEEEMELDIDNLNVNCLNELDKFVTKSNNDIRRKNAKERAKQRRNERRRQERARKLREQQEEAEQQRMQQRQQQMQMSSNISMFGNSASNNSNSLLNSGGAPSSTQQSKTVQPQQNTSAPPQQKQQQAYVESDEDNDEALASGATGNFDAEFETSGNDNLWSQMGAGSQSTGSGASKPQPGNAASNNFEEEEDFDAGF